MSVAIRIIPCLDVKDGRVVKGVNFQGLKDAGDPVELASRYCAQGADEITFLDISASHEGRSTMLDVVCQTAEQIFVPLTVGGGVRSLDDVDLLLKAGADKVSINTAAIEAPSLLTEVAQRFGNQVIVLSVDARRCPSGVSTASGFEVTTHGGRTSTGIDAVAWAVRGVKLGAGEILLKNLSACTFGNLAFNEVNRNFIVFQSALRNVFGTKAGVEKPISMFLRNVPDGGAFGGNEIISGGYAGLGLIVGG